MIIAPITNGIVIDHITAGKAMELYDLLKLSELSCSVAIITKAESQKMGRKDIIKLDRIIELDLDLIGYVDPGVTINIINDGRIVKRSHLQLPEEMVGVIECKNPRCISSTEQELPHRFKLSDREHGLYRCVYCDTLAEKHHR